MKLMKRGTIRALRYAYGPRVVIIARLKLRQLEGMLWRITVRSAGTFTRQIRNSKGLFGNGTSVEV